MRIIHSRSLNDRVSQSSKRCTLFFRVLSQPLEFSSIPINRFINSRYLKCSVKWTTDEVSYVDIHISDSASWFRYTRMILVNSDWGFW